MNVAEVRKRYLDFFAKRGHAVIPSAPIVPENDPTTLFTSSGMQPLVPYLLGTPHPEGARLADSQLCFRAEDIEEVGDNRHTTFFEMLGNWSLGDYFKKEQLAWFYEFLTNKEEGLGLDPQKLYMTTFSGDEESGMPADTESVDIWKSIGVNDDHLFTYGAKKNWWSRAGVPTKMPAGEIGGPDSEVFYDFGTLHDLKFGEECHPNCDCGRFVEIGNSVFMQYVKQSNGTFKELPKKNVDFGGGLERLAFAAIGNPDIFMIDVFDTARTVLESRSGIQYRDISCPTPDVGHDMSYIRSFRVILDHMRAASFFIASGVRPGNSEQGYVLRRLIRRSIREADKLGIKEDVLAEVAEGFGSAYAETYPFVHAAAQTIRTELEKEEGQFRKTLAHGMRELEKMGDTIDTFLLYTTYGFPIELTAEIAAERGVSINLDKVREQMEAHQALSREGAVQKFAGGLADQAEQTVRYHTTHHLLLKALQMVLGPDVHQRGSNITSARLRIDFSYGQKMTDEQKAEVEKIVNEKIAEAIPVIRTDMKKEEAEKLGAEHEFGASYPDIVSVYSVGPLDNAFSIEFCGGPHVSNTSELKGTFKILKEEASSAGVRRIKAILQ
ncbi:MAG: alanine--tRNA ligase [Patescibacteria group bacterium]|nr:alanine--tRNA ligase [Patescibacteria group bacterium]